MYVMMTLIVKNTGIIKNTKEDIEGIGSQELSGHIK
jgi:hypothetical protein